MKLTIIFFFLAISQMMAIDTYSQSTRLSLNLKAAAVKDVLDKIEENSEFVFLYNYKLVDVDRKVTIDIRDQKITEILDNLFQGTNVAYTIVDRQIVLTSKADQTSFMQLGVQQANKVIKGKVTDLSGFSLPGVSVVVKGTTVGTVTDNDGNYSLSSIAEKAVLQFSFVGMKIQEIVIGSRTEINVVMEEESIGIGEVVAIGYGTQKKVSLTGAITNVNSEEIESIPTSNLSNTLAGRAPGVTISSNSGFVGSSSDILIRGKGTYNNTSPLYVIDGIVMDKTDFDVLDPNEVDNVSFLKDAATASIYGSRAANGVVLVTTKKGKIQKPVFNFKSSYSLERPTEPLQSYTASEQIKYQNDVAITYGEAIPNNQEIINYFKDKSYQLMDYIWRDPSSQQHNLSVNGGNDKLTYYMMVGYNKALGSFYNTDYSRYNFRSNVTSKINDYITVNFNLSGNQRSGNRFYWPYDDPESYTLQDFYRATFNWEKLWPFYVDENGAPTTDRKNGYPVGVEGWHPVELVHNGGYRKTVYRTLNSIFRIDVKIPFVDGLTTSFLADYTADDYNGKNFVKHNRQYVFQQGSTTNQYVPAPIDPNQVSIHNLSRSYEGIDENATFGSSYQLNWFLNYDKTFGKNKVSGMVVYEQQGTKGKTLGGQANNLLSSDLDQIVSASKSSDYRWFEGSEYEYARSSWIGRLHYEYAGKYIAEFSGRYDGSYIFDDGNRWGFFPSGSMAWRISEENFFDIKDISNLKIRGSIGTAGNDNVTAFQFQNNFVLGNSYVFGNTLSTGIAAGTPPNPDITWEKSTNYNFGADFGLFDNKLTGEFDYFYRYSYDILKERIRVIPETYGASLSSENYAKMDVRGIEFSLNYNNRIGDFKYTVGGNIGWAKDKVIYIDEVEGIEDWRTAIGHPLNRIWAYDDAGIIRDQATLDALPEGFKQWGDDATLGGILYKDIRGENRSEGADGKIDANDMTYLSDNAIPRINYGINLEGEWKNFTVNVLFQGVGAYDKIMSTKDTPNGGVFQGGSRPYFELWVDHWTPENTEARYPRAATYSWNQYGIYASKFWIRNGAYLRLKNLNIAYTLPREWTSRILVDKCQVYLNATNLFYLSGFMETDPEQYMLDSYPIMRSFSAGLSINF
ncbi:MAG: TonB-dependent receptor [Prolixibacteraceae bacterium]